MNRLFEIAEELGKIARNRYQTRNTLKATEIVIKNRELELTPEGGWPGKNADERKIAELTALKADGYLLEKRLEKLDLEDKLEDLEAEREALTEERDAIRWTIRDYEQTALSGASVLNELNNYLADQSETPVEENRPLAEREADYASAAIRLAELDQLGPQCEWGLLEIQLNESQKSARARWREIMEIQDAYEAKYHL